MEVFDRNAYYRNLGSRKQIDLAAYMHDHYLRLHTYVNWPQTAHAYPSRLASAGFYYEGNGDEVVCFSCKCKISSWQWGDCPKEKHRTRCHSCRFISGQDTSNVPLSPPVDAASTDANYSNSSGGDVSDSLASRASGAQAALEVSDSSNSTAPRNQYSPTHGSDLQVATMVNNSRPNVSSYDSSSIFPTLTPSTANNYTSTTRGHSYYSNLTTDMGRHPGNNALITNGNILNSSTLRALNNVYRAQEYDEYAVSNAQAQYRNESRRFKSFRNWSTENAMDPIDLAAAGFMYTRTGDRVQCVFCFGILRNWEEGDNAMTEHRRYFPDCPFVQNLDVSNVPMSESERCQSRRQQQRNTVEALGVNAVVNGDSTDAATDMGIITDRPKHTDYAIEQTRLQSYQRWPSQMKQTPAILASAGFFYSGMADNVKCFFCDGGLRNWEPEDDPWMEHARWFPKCGFVKQVKGLAYIKEVSQNYPGQNNASNESGQFDRREIKARMDTATVRAVLDIGYTKELVTKAIMRRFLETGDDFARAPELLEAIFEIEEQIKNGTYVEPEIPTPTTGNKLSSQQTRSISGLAGGCNPESTDGVDTSNTSAEPTAVKTKKKKVPTATLR